MAKILISLIVCAGSLAFAQPSMNEDVTGLSQQGQLFSIKIVPGEKAVKLFVVGHKAADVKKTIYGVEASTYVGDTVKTLVVTPQDDHYIIQRPKTARELKLRLRSSNEKYEDFKIPLK